MDRSQGFRAADMARRARPNRCRSETVDTLVIGGGVAGSCLAYWLAREGIEAMVVERDDVSLQASGANAGSLHVQLLAFDFTLDAPHGVPSAIAPPTLCRSGRPRWRCGRRSSAIPARTSR